MQQIFYLVKFTFCKKQYNVWENILLKNEGVHTRPARKWDRVHYDHTECAQMPRRMAQGGSSCRQAGVIPAAGRANCAGVTDIRYRRHAKRVGVVKVSPRSGVGTETANKQTAYEGLKKCVG